MKTNNEKIIEILNRRGISPEGMSDNAGWKFSYDELVMYLMNDESEDKDSFLLVIVPGIVDFSDENRPELLKISSEINRKLRYVKVYESAYGSLDMSYEHFIRDEPDEVLVLHILESLSAAYSEICSRLIDEGW